MSTVVSGAPGYLDPTFGVGGRVIDIPYSFYDVAIQPDGKIVAVGAGGSDIPGPVVARYNVNGSPDVTFGNAGKVIIPVPDPKNKGFLAMDVAIQSDGKIVVAARDANGEPANGDVARLHSNGSLDTSFGTNGIVTGLFHPSIAATLPGGKLLITQFAQNNRFNADGSLDASYPNCLPFAGGVTGTSHPIMNRVESVILPDGRTVTAFIAIIAGRRDFGVFRCNQDGGLDTTFGSGGVVTTPIGPPEREYDAAQSIALQADGKFIVAGRSGSFDTGLFNLTVVRYNPDGSLDTGFGTGGIVATSLAVINPSYFGLLSVALQPNGKILVNATTSNFEAAVIRFNPSGSLDTTFGGGAGIAVINFNNGNGGQDYFEAMTLDSHGRAVVVGTTGYFGPNGNFVFNSVLARLLLGSPAAFDFDGDGKADIAVRRPSDNVWYLLRTSAGYTAMAFGVPGDLMTPADYDGDGKTDVAVFRASENKWYIHGSTAGFYDVTWGTVGDIPVPADYDGDGKADVAIYRPSTGTWYIIGSRDGLIIKNFGTAEDKPYPADYDGDGKADIVVRRPSDNNWYLLRTTAGYTAVAWGINGDQSAPADYDGDGKTDLAVFRPSDNTWYIFGSQRGIYTQTWGQTGDITVPADFDGDGKADIAVFRPSNGTWYIIGSSAGFIFTNFGQNGDTAVPSVFNY